MTTTPVVRTGMHMTLEEFLDLPEQEQRCELIDGVVYVAAFAVPDRAFLITALAANLSQRVMLTGAGIAMMAAGVVVSSDSALAPDITVVRAERAGIIGTRTIDGPPDIVVGNAVFPSEPGPGAQTAVIRGRRHPGVLDCGRFREHAHRAGIGRGWPLPGASGSRQRRHADHAAVPGVQPASSAIIRSSGAYSPVGVGRQTLPARRNGEICDDDRIKPQDGRADDSGRVFRVAGNDAAPL